MSQEDLSKLKIERDDVIQKGKRFPYHYVLVLLVAVIIITYFFYNPAVKVKSTTVSLSYPTETLTILNASGYVIAQRKAALASKTTGRLVWLGVKEGDYVKKDQIVARLENEDVLAAKNQAEANVELAKASIESANAEFDDAKINLDRQKVLFEKNFATQAELDGAYLRYKRAKAAVESANASLNAALAALKSASVAIEYTFIRAPFDGVVLTKNADIGDIITPLGAAANAKAAVVTIADLSSLLVEVDVSEANIGNVKLKQPCDIQLDAMPEKHFKGEVYMIVPTADRSKASIMIKVRFLEPYSGILPEMSAKVSFLSRTLSKDEMKEFLKVKRSAIVEKEGQHYVFLIKGDRAILTPVVIGKAFTEDVEVIKGLMAGDKVVLSPPANLKDNRKIKIDLR